MFLALSWAVCEHRGGLEHRIRRECMAYGKLYNDGKADQHLDYHHGTADIRQIMHWAGKYTEDADIVIEYEPHEKLTHAELLDEMHELRSWVEEGKALS